MLQTRIQRPARDSKWAFLSWLPVIGLILLFSQPRHVAATNATRVISFDVYENGNPMPAEQQIGALTSYFGLRFSSGVGTLANGTGTWRWPVPQNYYTLVPHSPPNVAFTSYDGPFIIQAYETQLFSVDSLYVGFVAGPRAPQNSDPVTIAGFVQNATVPSCVYTVIPNKGGAPTFVRTPGCASVDEIRIVDTNNQYWFIDDMSVTL